MVSFLCSPNLFYDLKGFGALIELDRNGYVVSKVQNGRNGQTNKHNKVSLL